MSSGIQDVESALIAAYQDCMASQTYVTVPGRTAYPNRTFTPPTDQSSWVQVWSLPSKVTPDTLGDAGQDLHIGIMQLDLNVTVGVGILELNSFCELVRQYFTAGLRLTYNGQEVKITRCSRSPMRSVNGWTVVSMSITWWAWITR